MMRTHEKTTSDEHDKDHSIYLHYGTQNCKKSVPLWDTIAKKSVPLWGLGEYNCSIIFAQMTDDDVISGILQIHFSF